MVAVYLAVQAWQTRSAPSGEAPGFEMTAIDGRSISLADYRGAPLMVHFWATWCGVCKAERHNVAAVAGDLPVLAVASRSGSVDAVAAFVAEHPYDSPVLVDSDGALAKRFGVRAYPTSFVLDADGVISDVEVGYTSELGMRFRMWVADVWN